MPFYQDVDAKLTLSRVATAPALIAEIAKSTGRHLEVSPVLRTEILMVSVENARVSEVLAKLAVAATATWQPVEGGYRLVADNAARGVEAQTERARRFQAIGEAMKKKAIEAAKAKKAEGADAEMAASFMGGGSVDAFVPMLDLGVLAAMESGDRIVFATNPNAAQRPLQGNPAGLVADQIAKHNKSAESVSASMNALPDGMEALLNGPLGDRMKRSSQTIVGTPTKIVVVASRGAMPFFGGAGLDIRLEVRAYDRSGAILIEQSGTIDTGMMDLIASLTPKKPIAPLGPTTPIVYTDEAKALGGLSNVESFTGGGMGGIAKSPKPTPALRKLLLLPTKNDPLALLPGEGLVALAKSRRKPLVACLPDAAYPALLGSGVPKTVEDVEEGLKKGAMRLVPDATFLVVKAAEPETARETRLDRTALQELLRAADDHESPSLEELATFASQTPPPARNPVSTSMLMLFAPSTLSSMSGMVSWDALRLYAALSPLQRQSLAEGAKIPFGQISSAGQNALSAMLYGATNSLSVDRPGVSNEPDPLSMGLKMAFGGGGVDARDEPTEIAPNGLPAGGYLQAAVTSEPIIRPLTAEGPSSSSVSADELAMVRLMSTSPMAAQMGDALRLPDSGRLGTRSIWNLKGYVASTAYVSATLDDDRTPKDGATVNFANLPDDLQARIAQRTEKLKNSPLGAILSMAGAAKGTPREP